MAVLRHAGMRGLIAHACCRILGSVNIEHPRNLLTDVAGIAVGNAEDLRLGSGVTVIVFDRPAVASVSVLGGAPGGRDTDMLAPHNTVEAVDAIVLSGGSAFGLDAAGGVQAALREQGRGIAIGDVRVPIVPQAIMFDLLNGGDKDWGRFSPYRDLGYAAACAVEQGLRTRQRGWRHGGHDGDREGRPRIGERRHAPRPYRGGDRGGERGGAPTIGAGPHFWAAPFEQNSEFGGRGLPASFDTTLRTKAGRGTGTTIGLVATDAVLTKAQAMRLAIMAHDGLGRAVLPAHAPLDGDTIFAAATGFRPMSDPVIELTELGHVATQVMARAIARGVYEAAALPVPGAQPSWRDRFATSG